MAITEQDMTEFLDANRDAFLKAARQSVIDRITETMKWNLPDVVNAEVKKFLTDEIAPEVAKILKDEKGAIIEAAKKSAASLGNAMAEKIVELAVKNINTSYRAHEIFGLLFKA